MDNLSLLRLWETGLSQHSIDRALTILAAEFPDLSRKDLALWNKGRRDAELLKIRERWFGERIAGQVRCEFCQALLEIEFALDDVRTPVGNNGNAREHNLHCNGYEISFRAMNSFDLADAVDCADAELARKLLIKKCLLAARRNRKSVPASKLPKRVVAELAKKLSEIDPQAEVILDLRCTECGKNAQVDFDIASFLWSELQSAARRLFLEVHTLARFYGWREQDILAMNPTRRRVYLELLS